MNKKIQFFSLLAFVIVFLTIFVFQQQKAILIESKWPELGISNMLNAYRLLEDDKKIYVVKLGDRGAIYALRKNKLLQLDYFNGALMDAEINEGSLYYIESDDISSSNKYFLKKINLETEVKENLADLELPFFREISFNENTSAKIITSNVVINESIKFEIINYKKQLDEFKEKIDLLSNPSKEEQTKAEEFLDQYLFNLETLNETYCYNYEFDGSTPETETLQYYEIFDCESGKFIEKIKFDLSGLMEKYPDPEAQYTSFRHKLISYQPDHWVIDAHRFTATDKGVQQFLVTKRDAKKYMEGDVIDFEKVPLQENIVLDSIKTGEKIYNIVLEGSEVKLASKKTEL